MIPISLTIQGYYSYIQRQTIDFTHLTKAGVFGIFGSTGAGKSAIVEAIVFALYGETERINNREDRSYNMMNLQSNELYIEFICSSEHTHCEYKIIVSAKRTKTFEKVNSIERTVYKYNEQAWIPVEQSIIEKEVTGLSYDNFKRTVMIPQGQFMEFLQLRPTERTHMLKEIFGLHKFELTEQIKGIEHKVLHSKTLLQGNLQEIGEIQDVQIQELIKKEQEILDAGTKLRNKTEELRRIVAEQTSIQANAKKLDELHHTYTQLSARQSEFVALEKTIENVDYCNTHFSPLFDRIHHLQKDVAILENQLKELQSKQVLVTSDFELKTEAYKTSEQDFLQIEKIEQLIKDLQKLLECKSIEVSIEKQNIHFHEIDTTLKDLQQKILLDEQNQKAMQLKIAELKNALEDISVLISQKEELQKYLTIRAQIEECRIKRVEYVAKIAEKQAQILTLCYQISCTHTTIQEIRTFVEKQILSTEKTIEEFETKIHQQKLENEIRFLHDALQDGIPCPVCGATEHPAAHTPIHTPQKTDDLLQKKKQLSDTIKQHTTTLLAIENIHAEIVLIRKEDKQVSDAMHSLTIERNLSEPDFAIRDMQVFTNKIELYSTQTKTIQQKEVLLSTIQEQYTKTLTKKNELQSLLAEVESQRITLRSNLQLLRGQLSTHILESYQEQSLEQIEIAIESHTQRIVHIQQTHKTIEIEYISLKEESESLRINIEAYSNRYKVICEELSQYKQKLLFAIEKSHFTSLEDVQLLVSQNHSVIEMSKALERYKADLANTQKQISELKKLHIAPPLLEDEFLELSKQLQEHEVKLQESRDEYIRIHEQVKQTKEKFEKSKQIQKQLEQINHELNNIHTLKLLFKQNGFVSYMSTRYLNVLCDIANKRFSELTRQSLRLEIHNSSFYIRDYLNNGKLRHIKTLSGGQSFQAALSLALALSETIHIQTPVVSNFFFIDEGFGSQDKESLQMVFDTLRSLQIEGKTVGIISHVEELKENIPLYIHIQNSETGSKIIS